MNKKRILKIIKLIEKQAKTFALPWVTALAEKSKDSYLVLIASLLSVRTKDRTTQTACQRLFACASTPAQMLKLSPEKIYQLVYPVGFYRRKTWQILEISRILKETYKGKVPSRREDLISLPGVGRKVANLVLGLSFGLPAICVDTHVHRISNRLGIIETKNVFSSEKALEAILPQNYWVKINTLMVSFGQNICLPLIPYCRRCSLGTICLRKGVENFR